MCLPPGAMGKITYVAEHGNYDITEKVLEVEFQGQKKTFTMMHVSEARQTLLRCLKMFDQFSPAIFSCLVHQVLLHEVVIILLIIFVKFNTCLTPV